MTARRIAAAVGWAGAAAVAVRGAGGSYRLLQSLRWLSQARNGHAAGQTRRRHVLIVVPLLREQRLIQPTTAYLTAMAERWGPASVVLATTEREHVEREVVAQRLPELAAALRRRRTGCWLTARFGGALPSDELIRLAGVSGDHATDYPTVVRAAFDATPSTPDLAAKLAATSDRVFHHHATDPAATMVHQINGAVAAELERLGAQGVAPAEVWIAVYNADSRPHPHTLDALTAVPADARVIQQSALFTVETSRSGLSGVLCDGAALLQSRWTLAREIPRLRAQARQARSARRPLNNGGVPVHRF
ncbi:hypothetical protein [Micromonospora sp. CPCC 206061]|uniref:hypothetical protein n=1 Tax=Micromonospora sp. CPCC 206061 TaxID=3122410 RepID=UPI002FF25BFC